MEALEAAMENVIQRLAAIELNGQQQQQAQVAQEQAQAAQAPNVRDDNIAQGAGDQEQMKI